MIWPMANSQMLTSKKPSVDANPFIPRDTKMIRMVDSVTTVTSAANTTTGNSGDTDAIVSANTANDRPP